MRSHIGSSAAGGWSASPGADRPDEIIMSAMLTYFGLFVTQNGLSAKGSFSPTGVPIPKFAYPGGTLSCELLNQRDTSKSMIAGVVLDLKFLYEFAAYSVGTSNPPHQKDRRHCACPRSARCHRP